MERTVWTVRGREVRGVECPPPPPPHSRAASWKDPGAGGRGKGLSAWHRVASADQGDSPPRARRRSLGPAGRRGEQDDPIPPDVQHVVALLLELLGVVGTGGKGCTGHELASIQMQARHAKDAPYLDPFLVRLGVNIHGGDGLLHLGEDDVEVLVVGLWGGGGELCAGL